jgi:hypothetical protein
LGSRVSTGLALAFTLAVPFAASSALVSSSGRGVSDLLTLVGPPFLELFVFPIDGLLSTGLLLSEGKGGLGKASGSCHGASDGGTILVVALAVKVPLYRVV